MHLKRSLLSIIAILSVFAQVNTQLLAQELSLTNRPYLFQGEVKADNINIRSDSSINAEVVCKVNRLEVLDVLSELYDWYKIRLPVCAPSYIKKDLILLNADNTASVLRNNVNIRLHPNTSAKILGKAQKGDSVKVLEEKADWYRIEPIKESFGWIHKNFMGKLEEKKIEPIAVAEEKKKEVPEEKKITLQGIIKPKVFKRVATHKLLTIDNELYLLKGDKVYISSFNHRKARLTGKIAETNSGQNLPILEVEKIEAID